MSNIDELIEQLRKSADFEDYPIVASFAAIIEKKYLREAADALEKLQAENEKLRAELEQVKRERDAAVDCIYQIEDDLDRGNDNDWAREHIAEWESQKEDGHGTALQNDTLCV